ncbi:MAG: amidohydrolase, partial [Gammaproteobacteria bacterium]|nr:amidohydrolase [Gammaproteobacteria bacterium]
MASGFRLASLGLALAVVATVHADEGVTDYVDADRKSTIALAQDIWQFAEMGYLETQSTARLQAYLQRQGFDVRIALAGMPTSFVATYGVGQPVIGILAEFDALPGLSQTAKPAREARIDDAPGHA